MGGEGSTCGLGEIGRLVYSSDRSLPLVRLLASNLDLRWGLVRLDGLDLLPVRRARVLFRGVWSGRCMLLPSILATLSLWQGLLIVCVRVPTDWDVVYDTLD